MNSNKKNSSDDSVTRLIKVISEAGIASRRKCEKFILNGRVRVNNNVIRDLSHIVEESDEVSFDRQIIERETKHYIALYKPMGVVSTTKSLPGQRVITEFFKDIKERLFYAGRLDSESRGIMIITNDGEFANIITHPSYEILKVYDVTVVDKIDSNKLLEASFGVTVKGVKYSPFKFTVLSKGRLQSRIRITINEGKNREIRKIFEYLGYKVKDLERISVGIVGKYSKEYGTLQLGQTRRLTEEEIAFFFEQKKNVSKKFIDVDDILDADESIKDLDDIFSSSNKKSNDNIKLDVIDKPKREPRKKKQNKDKWAKAKPKDKRKFKNKNKFGEYKKSDLLDDRPSKRGSEKSFGNSNNKNRKSKFSSFKKSASSDKPYKARDDRHSGDDNKNRKSKFSSFKKSASSDKPYKARDDRHSGDDNKNRKSKFSSFKKSASSDKPYKARDDRHSGDDNKNRKSKFSSFKKNVKNKNNFNKQ